MYDFEAQPATGELSISSGDILTVIRTDVGDGWWEGTNTRGESGLFPEAYVEVRNFFNEPLAKYINHNTLFFAIFFKKKRKYVSTFLFLPS